MWGCSMGQIVACGGKVDFCVFEGGFGGDIEVAFGGIGDKFKELTGVGGAEYWGVRGWKKDRIDG